MALVAKYYNINSVSRLIPYLIGSGTCFELSCQKERKCSENMLKFQHAFSLKIEVLSQSKVLINKTEEKRS